MKSYVTSTALMVLLSIWVLSMPLQTNAQQPRRGASARKPRKSALTVRFASGKSALKIPFEFDGNIILLRVRVNNSEPLKFIFDTGASISVIEPQRAAELGLKTQEQIRGNATGGAIQASLIRGVSLSVPGAKVANQLIVAVSFGATPCFEFDGITGYDFINEFVVEIDYRNRIMNLYDPRTYTYSGTGAVVPLSITGRTTLTHPIIILEGREPVEGKFEVDTGGDGTLVIYRPFVEKHRLLAAIPKTVQSSGVGAGGEQEVLVGRVKAVQLGQLIIDNPTVGFSQNTEEADEKGDGLIGGEILRRFKVILDYSRTRMILESNQSFGDPYEVDMSGIGLGSDEDDCKALKIERVAENSPAAEAGLQSGDIVTAIDGKSANSFSSNELEQIFKQHGKELTLSVKRGESITQRKIKLRKLI
ncbi:MAG: aspartyl protease family protein [Pyrinomonadaceae bacterium]|nr:aspartyl protease family protein [Pyrinomonadaceae bacterium]